MISIFYFLILPLLVRGQLGFWDKHYITYSVENDLHHLEAIQNVIKEMDITTLEIQNVTQGEGDIKIYFVDFIPGGKGGIAYPPDDGRIRISRSAIDNSHLNVSKLVQHEFAHALGLEHSTDMRSIMYPVYSYNGSFMRTDKDNLNELYKCRYDSVTFLDDITYIKFKGNNYATKDLNSEFISENKLWDPFVFKVNAMYKNNTYFIIFNDFKYLEYNDSMEIIREGFIRDIFPNIDSIISAVLTLRNGSIICFLKNGQILYDGVSINKDLFEILPKGIIQGAFSILNHIYLVVKDYIYTYDEDFQFINQHRLCEDSRFRKVHCCNGYSNM